MKKLFFAIIFTTFITLFISCDSKTLEQIKPSTDIKDIIDSPSKYNEKTVKIKGTVKDSFFLFGKGYFVVSDKTGEIHVIPTKTMPKTGEVVTIIGKVVNTFVIGNHTFTVIVEEDETKATDKKGPQK